LVSNSKGPKRRENRSRAFKNRFMRKILKSNCGEVSDNREIAY
jgi:hypothetical protein